MLWATNLELQLNRKQVFSKKNIERKLNETLNYLLYSEEKQVRGNQSENGFKFAKKIYAFYANFQNCN